MGHDDFYSVQDTPIPSHPGAVGARAWIEKRSTTLVPLPPVVHPSHPQPNAYCPIPRRTDEVSAARFWLAALAMCAFGAVFLLTTKAGLLLERPDAVLVILGLVVTLAGFAGALIFRAGTILNAGKTIATTLLAALLANAAIVTTLTLREVAASSRFDVGYILIWLLALVLLFAVQTPLLILGAALGNLATRRQ